MPEPPALAEGSWNNLFDFLDPRRPGKQGPDRDEQAAERCMALTRKLACFFAARGCRDPEDLAATTVLRVAARCRELDRTGFDDPTGYFYGVARNVLHEAQRGVSRDTKRHEMFRTELVRQPIPEPESWRRKEVVHGCLDRCLAKLNPRVRDLLLRYYSGEGREKTEGHRALAGRFGKSANALRIEVHRARRGLRECVFTCLHPRAGGAGAAGREALGIGQG